jgi:hypothetical protein
MNYDAQSMANELLANAGSVGAALSVQPQMLGATSVGAPLIVQPQMVGAPVAYEQSTQGFARTIKASPEAYMDGGLTYLGFGSTAIAAGAVNIQVPINTQRPFTPQHLRCPSTVFGLLINAVLLEGTNLFANQAGVPIELFSEVATAQQIPWPTLDTSTGLIFQVSNPTAGSLNFQGGFYGTQVRR